MIKSIRSATIVVLVAGGVCFASQGPASRPAASPERVAPGALADRLGCAHASGRYNFTDKDFLNEGADRIRSLGMRVIKVYLNDTAVHYPFNSHWPKFENLVEVASHPYFQSLFRKDFSTYVLTTMAIAPEGKTVNWRDGVSSEEYELASGQFHALARYLLRTYRGTGKTFILQNWEGDWAVRGSTDRSPKADPSDTALEGMIRWMDARQTGVDRARKEITDTDVKVYNACEVNLVAIAMNGRPTVTNNVLPKTHCDLYSYSSYDTIEAASREVTKGPRLFRRALDYIASKAPDSAAFGNKNVYVGEFGWPCIRSEKSDPGASEEKSVRVIRTAVEEALDWGCPYVVYWQVYDNEVRSGKNRPRNDEVRGFYLIRPDGTHAPAWDYFSSLLTGRERPRAPRP
jgi:hypothetical protein